MDKEDRRLIYIMIFSFLGAMALLETPFIWEWIAANWVWCCIVTMALFPVVLLIMEYKWIMYELDHLQLGRLDHAC